MQTKIYVLIDPRDGIIKYVGKTVQKLKYRLTQHITEKSNNKRKTWIKSLKNKGLLPIIEELDECEWEESAALERYWISQFKTWGFVLKNMNDGGDGNIGYHPSEETRLKLGNSLKKSYRKYGHPLTGYKHTEESKHNMSLAKKGKKMPQSMKDNARLRRLGKKLPENAINRMIEVHGRRIIQLTLENIFIKEFYTIKEASIEILNKTKSDGHIVQCCQGKRPVAYGYKWMYKEDYLKAIENKEYK